MLRFLRCLIATCVALAIVVPAAQAAVTRGWTPAGDLGAARHLHGSVRLDSGQVLVAGGFLEPSQPTRTAELFDPGTRTIFCQPHDAERLHAEGFTDARPVFADATLGQLLIARTDGRHGTGEIGAAMGIVSGFVLHAPNEPSVYVAGDTILCDEVRAAITEHKPAAVLVNASAARFDTGDPIVMTNDDVLALAGEFPETTVVAIHFETVSHSTETRADLRARIAGQRILVPDDGSDILV